MILLIVSLTVYVLGAFALFFHVVRRGNELLTIRDSLTTILFITIWPVLAFLVGFMKMMEM
jgi:hypothetical protein